MWPVDGEREIDNESQDAFGRQCGWSVGPQPDGVEVTEPVEVVEQLADLS